jgi:hypothetical protein
MVGSCYEINRVRFKRGFPEMQEISGLSPKSILLFKAVRKSKILTSIEITQLAFYFTLSHFTFLTSYAVRIFRKYL